MGEKQCTRCGGTKVLTEFPNNKGYKDGVRSWCRCCVLEYNRAWRKCNNDRVRQHSRDYYSRNKEKCRQQKQRWFRDHPDYNRERHLRTTYGITARQYDEMFCGQASGCAICGAEPTGKALHVDHCHGTNKVRALLCGPCNQILGLSGELPDLLRLAALYLEESNK